jgi:hypothetical protein
MPTDFVFIASGFLYDSEQAEIAALTKGTWLATTLDMSTIAVNTAGVTAIAVGSLLELIAALDSHKDAIERVRVIGHANSDGSVLAFAGRMDPNSADLTFRADVTHLDAERLPMAKRNFELATAGKLTKDCRVTLYGCHSGGSTRAGPLLKAVAASLGVRAEGFRRPLKACIAYKTAPADPALQDPAPKGKKIIYRIAGRGWLKVASGPEDPRKPCSQRGYKRLT